MLVFVEMVNFVNKKNSVVICIVVLLGVFDCFVNFFYVRGDGRNMFYISVCIVGNYFSESCFVGIWWFLEDYRM